MSKYKVFLSLVIIILLVIYSRPYFNAQSLVELLEGDINEVDAVMILNLKSGQRSVMDEFNEPTDLKKLQEIVGEADVKRVWNPFVQSDYSTTFSDHDTDFWLSISRKGIIYIQDDVEKCYKFVDEQLFEDLLKVLDESIS